MLKQVHAILAFIYMFCLQNVSLNMLLNTLPGSMCVLKPKLVIMMSVAVLAYMSWWREGSLGECPALSADHSCILGICTMLSVKKKLQRHGRQPAFRVIMAPR